MANAATREAAARAYAEDAGTQRVIVFIRDPDIGELLPAPGFPQTLPGRAAWRAFLNACVRERRASALLALPGMTGATPATGVAFADQAVLAFLGGSPSAEAISATELVLPLLTAALAGERAIRVAEAQAELAQRSAQESRTLARVLDSARGELQEALNRAEEQQSIIQRQATELEVILEAMPDAVSVCDTAGTLIRVNARATRLFGLPLGRTLLALRDVHASAILFRPDGAPLSVAATPLMRALDGVASEDVSLVLRRPGSDEDIQLLISAEPLRDENGAISGAVAVATDVTTLYQLQRQKDEFLSIASHELRTPLTTLKAVVQLAERSLTSGRSLDQRMLARMEPAIDRMERLIADLLDTSRIQAGKMAFRFERVDLVDLCRRVVDDLADTTERAIRTTLPDENIMLTIDPDRILQVLVNLLTNALKYSPTDRPVELALALRDTHVLVSVQDYGDGIPPDALPHVFDRFYRVAAMPTQSGSQIGLGLGLYIAKTIVDRHGGEMGVRSEQGSGSTFWFTLPFAPLATSTPADVPDDDAVRRPNVSKPPSEAVSR